MHDHAAELDALGVRAEPQQDTACLSEDEHAVGQDSLQSCLERKADEKRALLRRPEYDPPACVAEGLFIGGVGAARDLEALQALGITHVVNASPIVPCFHRRKLRYRSICVYDDEHDDIAQFFEATNAFIAKGRRKGGVLVHCYAGQSRSSTLVMAYLIARERLQVGQALHILKTARPCAGPNSGFLRQLDVYSAAFLLPAVDLPEAADLAVVDSSEAEVC